MSADERRIAQRRAIAANVGIVTLAIATGGLSGDIVQLYASQVLQLSPSQIGLALSLLMLAVPAQVYGIGLARRFGKKGLLQLGYSATVLWLCGLVLLPQLFQRTRSGGYLAFAALIILIECSIAGSWGVVWHPWMRQITTVDDRGRFFARMRFSVHLFNTVALGLFSFVVGSTVSATDYGSLIGVLIIYLLFAIGQIRRIPEPSVPARPARVEGLSEQTMQRDERGRSGILSDLKALGRNREFIKLMVVLVIGTVTSVPMFALYASSTLRLTGQVVTRVLTLRTFAVMATLLFWGSAIDRFGYRRVMMWNAIILAFIIPLWLFVTPVPHGAGGQSPFQFALVSFMVMSTAALANGFAIAHLAAIHAVIDDARSLTAFTLFDFLDVGSRRLFIAFASLVLGGLRTSDTLTRGFVYIDSFKILMVAGSIASLMVAWWSKSLKRPPARIEGAPVGKRPAAYGVVLD